MALAAYVAPQAMPLLGCSFDSRTCVHLHAFAFIEPVVVWSLTPSSNQLRL